MEMKGRRKRLSAMSLAYTAAVLVALGALAFLSARRGGRIDVTETKRHSLQPATRALIDSIPDGAEPVDILAITSPLLAGGNAREAESQVGPLLNVFARHSQKVRISLRFAEQEPALVNQLGIDRLPLVLLSWQPPTPQGGEKPPRRERRTHVVTESGITKALRELIEDEKRIAYFTVGHGELRIGEAGGPGGSLLATTLQGLNFDTRELGIAGSGDIPADADLVVVAGPQSDFSVAEIAALDRYGDGGGRILVFDGPTRDFDDLLLVHSWLSAKWNLEAQEGLVADFEVPLGADPRILLVLPKAADHPLLQGLERYLHLPLTRNILFLDRALDGVAVAPLLMSGERSWLERDLASAAPRYDEGIDERGPFAIAWSGTRRPPGQEGESRLIVFGTRMAFADQYIGSGGNMGLLRNSVDWLTGREADIEARLGSATDGAVIIADRQGRIILATMLVLPVIVSLTGVIIWWRRRRL